MKANVARCAAVVLLSLIVAGCTSLRARKETPDDKWSLYPGVKEDARELDDLFSSQHQESGWIKGVIAPILIFDLPFSALFDTFAMPYDLYRIRNPKSSKESGG